MAGSESEHYKWLVEARSRIQSLLLDLYIFGVGNADGLPCDPTKRSLFGLFVGAAFSLWRAAFLSDTKRAWPKILEDANKLLDTLLRDNAVTYPQDRNTREWMGGYYLNNARFRLAAALEKFREQSVVLAGTEVVSRFEELHGAGIEGKDPTESWDVLHDTLREVFEQLRKSSPA